MAELARAFLTDSALSDYADAFIDSGFDNLDMLLNVKEDDLKELGWKAQPLVKIYVLTSIFRSNIAQHNYM